MLLKKKASQTKQAIKSLGLSPNEEPLVYYVTLTSVDKFGFPEYPTGLFDQFTKKSMKKQNIIPITIFDLEKDLMTSPHYNTLDYTTPDNTTPDHTTLHHTQMIYCGI